MDTRRTFVARMVGLLAMPALVSGCKRSTSRAATPTPTPTPGGAPLPGSPLPVVEPVVRVRIHRERGRGLVTLGRAGRTINLRHVEYEGAGVDLPAPNRRG